MATKSRAGDKSKTLVEQMQTGLRCWHCGRPVTEWRGGEERELLNKREALCRDHGKGRPEKWHKSLGPVWVTLEALLTHGLFRNYGQHIEDYPAEWRKMYIATSTDPAYLPPNWVDPLKRGDSKEMWAKVKAAIRPGRPRYNISEALTGALKDK